MRTCYIIIFLLFLFALSVNGQSLLPDTIKAKLERQEYSFIVVPAYYEQISHQLNLSKIDEKDSFSFRLWSGNMLGYNLITLKKGETNWEANMYKYYSDATIKEIKIYPEISFKDFIERLREINFSIMKTQHDIQDFHDKTDDGVRYTLEIIKGKTYKVIQYNNPWSFNDMDNKNFALMLKLIDNYFHVSK